jgi:hypothetical protein
MTTPIYCFNNSTLLKTSDMALMISALNTMLPTFCSVWSPMNRQFTCVAAPPNTKPGNGIYCVFLDNTDSKGALAYHTETNAIPLAKVFVGTILQYGGVMLMGANSSIPTVAQAFAHELFEMIANLNANIWWQMSSGNLVAGEVGDPVQGNIVPVKVGSVTVGLSDYILPTWKDPQAKSGPYNYLNTLTKPFQLAKGGYAILMKQGQITNVLGKCACEYITYRAKNVEELFKAQIQTNAYDSTYY